MPKPTTRQDSKVNTSRRSKTPPRRTVVNPNLIDLSVSGKGKVRVTTRVSGRGRGSTPLRGVSLASSSLGSQSSTSIRAIRASPVSCSLDSYQTEATDSNVDNFGNNLLSKSTSTIDTEPLEDSSVSTLAEILVKPNNSFEMPDEEGSRGTEKQPQSGSTMENLMAYFQEAMRSTQDEFRRELAALRESLGASNNNRSDSTTLGMSNQPSGSQTNASYGSFPLNFKLKDWKISYSGDSSVSDFLFKLDTLVERSQCPHDHLLSNFHIFLTGKAETFYWDYIRQYQRATYPMLRTALSKEFGSRESDHEILLKISTRKQLPKESYDDFHSFIVRWNLRLTNPMSDSSLIEILKKNVNADLKVMLFISDPKDLGSLRDLARKAEKVLAENKSATTSRQRHINEVSVETAPMDTELEIDPQIEALKINRSWTPGDYSKIKCWNCLQLGHSYIYCPDENRQVFCYKCGKRGVTTVKCDVPHAGNRRRSEWATGDARSSK